MPDGLAFETAALTEPCCVAYNATVVNARVCPGDRILVLGPGPIGNSPDYRKAQQWHKK